jgi:DNA modification methylase
MATLTLHKGDCLAVMKDISANSIDLIICDLPYGVLSGGDRRGQNTKENDPRKSETMLGGCAWDVKIDLTKFWTEAKRILKNEHSPVIHFCTTKFGAELINSNPSWFRYDLVWDKGSGVSFLSANKMPMRSHEMIYVFSKAGAYYNRVDISGNFTTYTAQQKNKYSAESNHVAASSGYTYSNGQPDGKRCVKSVINISNSGKGKNHPTEKPTELYKWLIERYCPPDGTVLDPTFGSGNSVFTAFEMGRNAIGIEMNDVFYEKAEKKLNTIE